MLLPRGMNRKPRTEILCLISGLLLFPLIGCDVAQVDDVCRDGVCDDEIEAVAKIVPSCEVVYSLNFEHGLPSELIFDEDFGRIQNFEQAVERQGLELTEGQRVAMAEGNALVEVVDLSGGSILHPNGVVENPQWLAGELTAYTDQFDDRGDIEHRLREFEARLLFGIYDPTNAAQQHTRALYLAAMTGECDGDPPPPKTCDATCYLSYTSTRSREYGGMFLKDEFTCAPALGAANSTGGFVHCSPGKGFKEGSHGGSGECDKRGVLEAKCDFAPSEEGACDRASCKVFGKDEVEIDVVLDAEEGWNISGGIQPSASAQGTVSTLAPQWNNAMNWSIDLSLEASTGNDCSENSDASLHCGITFVLGVPVPYCRIDGTVIQLKPYLACVSERWKAHLERHLEGETPVSYVEVTHFPGTATADPDGESDNSASNDFTQIGPMEVKTTHLISARSGSGERWAKASSKTNAAVTAKMTSVANGRSPANVTLKCEEGEPQQIVLACHSLE